MKIRTFFAFASLAILASLLARPAPAVDPEEAMALDDLERNGIRGDTASLRQFLTNGFPSSVSYKSLPERPPEKCQLLINAMQVLGKRGAKDAVAPLVSLARGQASAGIQDMIQRDALSIPAASRAAYQTALQKALQYNAAVALGFIGDRSAAPLLRQLFDAETEPAVRCQYALGLACCGDPSGIVFLVAEIQKANQTSSVAAAKAVYYIAGVDFGYTETSPAALRRKLAGDYTAWWQETAARFALTPPVIIRRRIDGIPEPRIAPTSVRNLVAMASNPLDFSDARGSRTAAEKLDSMGKDLVKDLEPILHDPMEDIAVRIEAMRRYVLLRGKDARKAMKKLSEDENPEIAAYAKKAVQNIESGAALRKPVFQTELIEGGGASGEKRPEEKK
ncbi:MAG: hypothetical protein NTW86_04980 [Candidatus Sumerlaeota bacterium]|nr:hypothetical protein [Candidatus Sumerlaeota bacterium]